ncbi:MAG TPA: hypothetical protein VH481_05005 [Nitrososphaeraceae archaeon]|jgi:hypothetical protein
MTPEGLGNSSVASYLSKGDNVTLKIHMGDLVNWNLEDSKGGSAPRVNGRDRPLDT